MLEEGEKGRVATAVLSLLVCKLKSLYYRPNTDHFSQKYIPNTDQFLQAFPEILTNSQIQTNDSQIHSNVLILNNVNELREIFFYMQHWKIQTEAKNTDQLQTNFRDFFPKVCITDRK